MCVCCCVSQSITLAAINLVPLYGHRGPKSLWRKNLNKRGKTNRKMCCFFFKKSWRILRKLKIKEQDKTPLVWYACLQSGNQLYFPLNFYGWKREISFGLRPPISSSNIVIGQVGESPTCRHWCGTPPDDPSNSLTWPALIPRIILKPKQFKK